MSSNGKKRKLSGKNKQPACSVFCTPLGSDMFCDTYSDFVFELKTLKRDDDPIRYEKLVKFGSNIYPTDDTNVGLRPNFSNDHFFQRISLFLLDCSAHISDEKMDTMRADFEDLFPRVKASSVLGGRIRIISTGSLLVVMKALLSSAKKVKTVCAKLLQAQTFITAQDNYKDKYVLLASALIEIFYLRNVRVFKSRNPELNYGLFLTSKPQIDQNIYLCCGINLSTHSHGTACSLTEADGEPSYGTDNDESNDTEHNTTATMIKTKRGGKIAGSSGRTGRNVDNAVVDHKVNKKDQKAAHQSVLGEYINGLPGGIFGVPYYINSVRSNESPTVNMFENKGATVTLYESGLDGKSGKFVDNNSSFTVDMTYIRLRSRNSKGRINHQVGEEVLWKYHSY